MEFEFEIGGMEIVDRPVRLPMAKLYPDIPLPPDIADGYLDVVYAGDYNREYRDERTRMLASRLARRSTSKPLEALTPEEMAHKLAAEEHDLQVVRDVERDLYPGKVIKGWGRIHAKGTPDVPFSLDAGRAFCAALCRPRREYMFDRLRAYCGNLANFVANAIPTEMLAGN